MGTLKVPEVKRGPKFREGFDFLGLPPPPANLRVVMYGGVILSFSSQFLI